MKKLEVFVSSFCERCGKDCVPALVPMQYGWAWMCLPCQLSYQFQVAAFILHAWMVDWRLI